jgi:hypothetical protein
LVRLSTVATPKKTHLTGYQPNRANLFQTGVFKAPKTVKLIKVKPFKNDGQQMLPAQTTPLKAKGHLVLAIYITILLC